MSRLLGEDEARQAVAVGVLLPVDEVALRLHRKRITEHRGAAVRRGAQLQTLRGEPDGARISVRRFVIQGDANCHISGVSGTTIARKTTAGWGSPLRLVAGSISEMGRQSSGAGFCCVG